MSVEIDISQLNDLRTTVAELLQEAQRLSSVNEKVIAGKGTAVPIVILIRDNRLETWYRQDKEDKDIEVVRVSLMDAYEGPTPKRCDKYMAKIAAFLERKGLYQPRGAITDKTGNLFEDEKVKKIKI